MFSIPEKHNNNRVGDEFTNTTGTRVNSDFQRYLFLERNRVFQDAILTVEDEFEHSIFHAAVEYSYLRELKRQWEKVAGRTDYKKSGWCRRHDKKSSCPFVSAFDVIFQIVHPGGPAKWLLRLSMHVSRIVMIGFTETRILEREWHPGVCAYFDNDDPRASEMKAWRDEVDVLQMSMLAAVLLRHAAEWVMLR